MPGNDNRDPRTYTIIGAAMEVHRQLGCGFLEAVYQEVLAIEFETRNIPCRREVDLAVFYKGRRLNTEYRADFICYETIVVELKALTKLGGVEQAQVINYLKSTGFEIGLLINFGSNSLEHKRYILSSSAQSVKSADDQIDPQITPMTQIQEAGGLNE